MANKSKGVTSSSEAKGGTTIVGTPKSSNDGSSPTSLSSSNRKEIRKEDILAHLTVDDVKAFLNGMTMDALEDLVENVPIVVAEKKARLQAELIAENSLDSQKHKGFDYDDDIDISLKDPTDGEGFRPTYENFLPQYSEPFRSMRKDRYGSIDSKTNIGHQPSSTDDANNTQSFFNHGTSTTATSTTASTTNRRGSSNIASTTAVYNSNAATSQPQIPNQGQNFPSSTATSTAHQQHAPPTTFGPGILPTGLGLRPTPRPLQYLDYDHDRVVVSKNSRGSNNKERAKIRELCIKPITPLLDNSNVKKLLSAEPGADNMYDIAEDATTWQDGIDNIHRHAVNFDFKAIFLIPSYFDLGNANSIPANATFTNSILDHTKVPEQTCYKWQEFLRQHGLSEDITSDHWMEEKLWKSLSPSLLKEVRSDFKRLPMMQQGAVSLVRIIINRMVQDSQDSRRALEEYVKTFSIRNFPGEDVTMARVLDGFSHASTPAFKHLCNTQVAMMSSSLIRNAIRNEPLYDQLDQVMHDLEIRFMELRSGQNWLGVGHGSTTTSAFVTTNNDSSSESEDSRENTTDIHQYRTYKASLGSKALPFDEWVRDKTCHHCGEKGHIQGEQCPTYFRDVFAGRIQLPPPKQRTFKGGRNSSQRKQSSTRNSNTTDRRYKKFFQAIMTALVDDDGDDRDSSDNDPLETTSTPSAHTSASKHDHSGFLAALGCPKE